MNEKTIYSFMFVLNKVHLGAWPRQIITSLWYIIYFISMNNDQHIPRLWSLLMRPFVNENLNLNQLFFSFHLFIFSSLPFLRTQGTLFYLLRTYLHSLEPNFECSCVGTQMISVRHNHPNLRMNTFFYPLR